MASSTKLVILIKNIYDSTGDPDQEFIYIYIYQLTIQTGMDRYIQIKQNLSLMVGNKLKINCPKKAVNNQGHLITTDSAYCRMLKIFKTNLDKRSKKN